MLPFFRSSESSQGPEWLKVKLRFLPLRLTAHAEDRVDLIILVENTGGRAALLSADIFLPRDSEVGFEKSAVRKETSIRIGEVRPGAKVEVRIPIFATRATRPGEVRLRVLFFAHSGDYGKVLYSFEKNAVLRCV